MIILGNSHAISLDLEYSKNRHEYKNITHIEYLKSYFDDLVKSNEDFNIESILEKEIKKNGKQSIVLIFGGELYNILSTQINEKCDFDFFLPRQKAIGKIDPDTNLIPYKLLYSYCMDRLKKLKKSIQEIKKINVDKIYLCLPIYPSKRTMLENTLRNKLNDGKNEFTNIHILNEKIRNKLWQLNKIVLEDLCKICDISFIPPPKNVCRKDTLLFEKYCHDGVHGNRKYAKLLLSSINMLKEV